MKPIKKAKGMALMEVLITMLVFALALLPLVRLQVLSMDATRAGFYKTETAAAAESMMDYLMTDVGAIFNNKWKKVVVTSGECSNKKSSDQEKIACEILNPKNARSHADKNAVLCIFGAQPKYGSGANDKRDQYLISIRAVWYSGKRSSDEGFYDGNLSEAACASSNDQDQLDDDKCPEGAQGTNYCKKMDSNILSKENIDYIKIDMAY